MISSFVYSSQSNFIQGIVLKDNTIVNHELVKGYERKGISKRCMSKIYMRKAYDSLEWIFWGQILAKVKFLAMVIKWIMLCVTTGTYSVIVNSKATTPFHEN